MFKWIKRLLSNTQSQIVGNNSFGIQVGKGCKIENSFNGRNIKTKGSLEIKNGEVWINGVKQENDILKSKLK